MKTRAKSDSLRDQIKSIEQNLNHATADTDTDKLCEVLEKLREQLQKSLQTRNSECLQRFNRVKFTVYRRMTLKFRKQTKTRAKRKRNRSTRIKAPPVNESDEDHENNPHYFRLINAWGV